MKLKKGKSCLDREADILFILYNQFVQQRYKGKKSSEE